MIFFLVFVLSDCVRAASIANIAQNIHSDVISLNANLASALPNAPKETPSFDIEKSGIPIGGALDLYYRYGFFSLSLRVVPRDDPGTWLVREPTTNIFQEVPYTTTRGPNSFAQQPFEISLCDDEAELKEAFFKQFRAEGIAQPHRLYTGSWRTPTTAKYLGITPDVLDGDSAFVLIRLTKNSGTLTVSSPNLRLKGAAASAASEIRAGDADSVLNFVQNYGSHYLQEVTVGDSIYQVLVLTRDQMRALKTQVRGARALSIGDWRSLYDGHLAPWRVRETGSIMVASGDVQLSRFADNELRLQAQFGSYPDLVGSMSDPEKVRRVEQLGLNTRAIVGANFASVKSFVGNGNIQVREFYDEIVDTNSALWESNL